MCHVCYDECCEFPGDLCYPDDYPEFYDDQPSADVMEVINQQAIESESSMSKKAVEVEVEKDIDKNGIITKQSEVYVWNDQVFASYKSALAASKKSKIIELLCNKQFSPAAGYSAAQLASYKKMMQTSPSSYSFSGHNVLEVIAELLAE